MRFAKQVKAFVVAVLGRAGILEFAAELRQEMRRVR